MLMEDCSQPYNIATIANIAINETLCTGCGSCVSVCPANVLELAHKKAACHSPERCIACAHCAAICPEDAITGTAPNPAFRFQVRNMPAAYSPVEKLLSNKRSIRRFTSQSLAPEQIEQLLFFAEKAPTARNSKTRSYYVLADAETIHKAESVVVDEYRRILRIMNPFTLFLIRLGNAKKARQYRSLRVVLSKLIERFDEGESPIFRKAPCVIIGVASKSGKQAKDDAVAAQHYLMLHAQSIGIGRCIIGYAQHASKGLSKMLGIGHANALYTVTVLGYPVHSYNKEILFPMPEVKYYRA